MTAYIRTTRLSLVLAALVFVLLATGCSSSKPATPTPSPTSVAAARPTPLPGEQTAVAVASAAPGPLPAANDKALWDFVAAHASSRLSPVLRPTKLPTGLDTVAWDQAPPRFDPDFVAVRYTGPGGRLQVLAGFINPSPPPATGYQQPTTVRGHQAFLNVEDASKPTGPAWVYWAESTAAPVVLYELRSDGLTTDELLATADSLQPYP